MDTLVTADWLLAHIADPDLVILDCSIRMTETALGGVRVESGRTDFEAGHLPGAVFADLTGSLRDQTSPLSFALPEPEEAAEAFGALGIGDSTRLVLYDRNGMMWAARVWWMLRWLGHDNAALLDGGLGAWTSAGGELAQGPGSAHPTQMTPSVRPGLMANQEEVRFAVRNPAVRLIDTLPEESFTGQIRLYARPGHIAGAECRPGMALLDENGHLLSSEALASQLPDPGTGRAITYCGGGILASLTAFAMTRIGHDDVAIYPGSLEEWAADPINPMETAPA